MLAGRFAEGIAVLAGYKEDERFNTWWPLWYYLGVAYEASEELEEAEKCYLRVLQLSPSNVEAMESLAAYYKACGEMEKAEKYTRKIEVVKHNAQLDQAEKNTSLS